MCAGICSRVCVCVIETNRVFANAMHMRLDNHTSPSCITYTCDIKFQLVVRTYDMHMYVIQQRRAFI